MLTNNNIFFNAAQSGLSSKNLKPEDLNFLEASFFDCDGVLLDSELLAMSDLGRKLSEAMVAVGHKGLNIPEFVTTYSGGHASTIIEKVLEQENLSLDSLEIDASHKISVIETLKNEAMTFEGMSDVVSFMHKVTKGKQAVITSSGHARVLPGLERNRLLPSFHDNQGVRHVYGIPDTKPYNATKEDERYEPKPEPYIYQHGMWIFNAPPKKTSTLEDSGSGVKSAVAAEVGYVIGFVGGSHIPQHRKEEHAQKLMDLGADLVIRDVREYPAAIMHVHRQRQLEPKPGIAAGSPDPASSL